MLLAVSLNSLNCLPSKLPESLKCDDETVFWDLYPILSFRKSCRILLKEDGVQYPKWILEKPNTRQISQTNAKNNKERRENADQFVDR